MRRRFSKAEFLDVVQRFLSADATVSSADAVGAPVYPLKLEQVQENRFYCFNPDAVEAFSHAVADLAMEEADGSFVSVFPRFREFAGHRDQYAQLGMTLDGVEAYGEGRVPGRIPRVRFKRVGCSDYRLTSFEGKRAQVLFVCRMGRGRSGVAHGFFTFDPRLIKRIRQDVESLGAGKGSRLPEFHRLGAIDSAAKQVESAFAREQEAMSQAFRRLQTDGGVYNAGRCANDLGKGLSRLDEWRRRLPKLLAQAR